MSIYQYPIKHFKGDSFAYALQILDGDTLNEALPADLTGVTITAELINQKGEVISAVNTEKLTQGFVLFSVDESVEATWPTGEQQLKVSYESDGLKNTFLVNDYSSDLVLIDVIDGAYR